MERGSDDMHYQCLIVDDEIELAKMTCEYFQMFDLSCTWVDSALACEEWLQSNTVDVVLMDINLGEDSGFQLVKKLRETYEFPILFISARQSDDDILIALNIGGDDYIKKPYTLSVLLAKVKATLRRLEKSENASSKKEASYERLWLDTGKMCAILDGVEIMLKAKEFRLLQVLMEHKNQIVSKEQLFNEVWGDTFFSDGTLNVHIRRLREKLETNPNEPVIIKTIWGTGYMLEI